MSKNEWRERWREGKTGWHSQKVQPWLEKYWPRLNVAPETRVLVPLCGKTLDLAWLAEQGLRVLGVELSALAIGQFFDDHGLAPVARQTPDGQLHAAGNIEIIEGDLFKVRPQTIASCGAVYDRAAVIALDADTRRRYANHVYGNLQIGCHGLAITLDYEQSRMQGPPFSVPEGELRELLGAQWQIDALDRREIIEDEPRFKQRGLASLQVAAYSLGKA